MIDIEVKLKEIFSPFWEAPKETWTEFAQKSIFRKFKKNEYLKETNSRELYLNIIIKGSAAVFYPNKGVNHCIDLCYENDFVCDYSSFLTQKASVLFVKAVEEVELLSISHTNLNHLYKGSIIGSHIGRLAAEQLFMHKQAQQIDLLSLTAEERYIQLLERSSSNAFRTPQKYIASYLGITAESFSRIKRSLR